MRIIITTLHACPVFLQQGAYVGECLDIDQCYLGTAVCVENANCINRPGTYFCRCPIGMTKKENSSQCEISYVYSFA